jgi:GT2 family glycosyltransferase
MNFSAVILSKNASNVDACVDSIREAGEECRVIVVDDGLSEFRSDCTYIYGLKPFNFARNANLGFEYAFKSGDKAVFLLNDDTRLLSIRGFSALAESDIEDFGVVSCAITDHVGNLQQLPRGVGFRKAKRTLAFIAVFVPFETWKLIGALDERFGVTSYGWEDNDYCRRVRNAGLKLGIFDHCIVEHGVLPSTFRYGNVSVPIEDGGRTYLEKWGDLS